MRKNISINPLLLSNWEVITIKPSDEMNLCYSTIHQAVQFIALIGRSFLQPRKDDSQTASYFNTEKLFFYGEWIESKNTFRVEFCPCTFELSLVTRNGFDIARIQLRNKSKRDVYARLKLEMAGQGLPAHRLLSDMHYDLPFHPVLQGGKYLNTEQSLNQELVNYYKNAYAVLDEISHAYSVQEPLRCWPHHFDISQEIDISKENNMIVRVGFSPSDSTSSEPYYYFKLESDQVKMDTFFGFSGIEIKKAWNGAILPVSILLKKANKQFQIESVLKFYQINFTLVEALLSKK